MNKLEEAIEILKEQREYMLELGDKCIRETGRGDFLYDGQVLGLAYAIGVLEELKMGEEL